MSLRARLFWLIFVLASGFMVLLLVAEDWVHRANPWTLGVWMSVFFGYSAAMTFYAIAYADRSQREIRELREAANYLTWETTPEEFQQMLDGSLADQAGLVSDMLEELGALYRGGAHGVGRPTRAGAEEDAFKKMEDERKKNFQVQEERFHELYNRLRRVTRVCGRGKLLEGGWRSYASREARTGTEG